MIIHDRKIKIAVVGCGKIATKHFNAIQALDDKYELICVCDNQAENLYHITTTLGINGYNDITTMLHAEPTLDIITLCSPSGLHAQQAIEIAGQQKHVISEKPMATKMSDGIAMINACDRAKVKLFVVKQNRYQPALQLLKNAIKNGRFGRIYLVNVNIFWTRPQSYYDQALWRGTWEFDGGAFMNQASHYVDLLNWLIGPVQSVQAMMATFAINMEAEDTGVLNIRWRSGTLGSMNVTMLTYPKNLEASITILGEKGTVRIGGVSANQIDHWKFEIPTLQDELALKLIETSSSENDFGHKIYYENVAATLQGNATADVDGREGLRSLEILTAAYLSARDNKSINLPLLHGNCI